MSLMRYPLYFYKLKYHPNISNNLLQDLFVNPAILISSVHWTVIVNVFTIRFSIRTQLIVKLARNEHCSCCVQQARITTVVKKSKTFPVSGEKQLQVQCSESNVVFSFSFQFLQMSDRNSIIPSAGRVERPQRIDVGQIMAFVVKKTLHRTPSDIIVIHPWKRVDEGEIIRADVPPLARGLWNVI